MKTAAYWKIGLALLLLFACGQGIGYALANWMRKRQSDPTPVHVETQTDWTQRALGHMKKQLGLTDAQVAQIEPRLAQTRDRLDSQRERALLQMNLELLQVHDEIAPQLTPDQRVKLAEMRQTLKEQIKKRFAELLADPSVPKPEL